MPVLPEPKQGETLSAQLRPIFEHVESLVEEIATRAGNGVIYDVLVREVRDYLGVALSFVDHAYSATGKDDATS